MWATEMQSYLFSTFFCIVIPTRITDTNRRPQDRLRFISLPAFRIFRYAQVVGSYLAPRSDGLFVVDPQRLRNDACAGAQSARDLGSFAEP